MWRCIFYRTLARSENSVCEALRGFLGLFQYTILRHLGHIKMRQMRQSYKENNGYYENNQKKT